ncbi:hypothetical protein V493_08327 [Pseudogymnoascus sp. VKM F-4281 (FW-2241)]|nr:hypothetical protein V493_08327 [Pseudogymnoascus sp. VKM F-4281 (FW-2241)]
MPGPAPLLSDSSVADFNSSDAQTESTHRDLSGSTKKQETGNGMDVHSLFASIPTTALNSYSEERTDTAVLRYAPTKGTPASHRARTGQSSLGLYPKRTSISGDQQQFSPDMARLANKSAAKERATGEDQSGACMGQPR